MSRATDAAALAAMFGLVGRVALVTGGAVGMGRASAVALAAAGATVILADEEERLPRGREIAAELGAEAIAVDVTSEASVAALFSDIGDRHGRLDILVNAVVLNHNRSTLEIDAAEWDHVQAVNLRSAFLATKGAVRLMRRAGGGRIVNMTTIGSRHPVLHGNGAYSASRAGLNQFTLNCALDFAADNITANAILPGAIITETVAANVPRSGPGTDRARMLHGYGTPEDVAGAVLLLAGPAGRYISGQMIAVDGGFLIS
ncbi:SDR family oxidoreductase [Sphingomonas histidinilytica]|uniref:Gluconate 5-dehydrogenase n=1 Tax=Rhizorhabdus histidinilytica TaxID=439228 RepID=A0A1T5FT69_9SPHN|nr:SDR family oxidoreductase [Rhizorhabdus histidinilytica]MBO9377035.1 SDR family oxidoreductase [Rhizorhabdus histidinilytica]SKB99369.1 gluconate 5-dehydrogenase [Rhizorhabdus histidinilytica]